MAGSIAPWINDPTQMSPSLNLGLSLLANSNTPGGFGSIFGKSVLGAGQNYQQAQLVQQQIEQAKLQQQMMRAQQGFLQDYANPQQPNQPPQQDPQQQLQQDQSFYPGVSKMPPGGLLADASQAPQTSAPQSQSPSWLTPPTAADISSIPIAGKSPQQIAAYDAYILKKDPLQTQKEIRETQFHLVQQQYAQKMTTLDNLIRTAQPSAAMKADPQLMAAWPQLASQAGIDPSQYNDANVRTALTFARNKVASGIGLPPIESKSSVEWKDAGDKLVPVYSTTGERVPGLSPISKGLTPEQSRESKNFSDEASSLLASLADHGVSLPAGLRSKEQQIATLDGLLRKHPDMTPDEIAEGIGNGQINFGSDKKAATVAAGQEGRVSTAVNELGIFGDQALAASAKVPRGSFVPANQLMQMADSSISDPNLLTLKLKLNALNNAYNVLSARGGTDAESRKHVAQLFSAATGPEGVVALVKGLKEEGEGARAAARQASHVGATPKAGDHPPDIQALVDKYK